MRAFLCGTGVCRLCGTSRGMLFTFFSGAEFLFTPPFEKGGLGGIWRRSIGDLLDDLVLKLRNNVTRQRYLERRFLARKMALRLLQRDHRPANVRGHFPVADRRTINGFAARAGVTSDLTNRGLIAA